MKALKKSTHYFPLACASTKEKNEKIYAHYITKTRRNARWQKTKYY
ncbi:hypothetical protein [Enterococcus sp. AZ091]